MKCVFFNNKKFICYLPANEESINMFIIINGTNLLNW